MIRFERVWPVALKALERARPLAAGRQRQNQIGPAMGASRSFGLAHSDFYECCFIIVCSVSDSKSHQNFSRRGIWPSRFEAPRGTGLAGSTFYWMPRFHFDIIESDSILRDEEGEICPDHHEAAEAEAIRTVSEMVKHGSGRLVDFERTVEVRDESAESLVRVRAVVKLEILRFK
jgi:hypothetical protein